MLLRARAKDYIKISNEEMDVDWDAMQFFFGVDKKWFTLSQVLDTLGWHYITWAYPIRELQVRDKNEDIIFEGNIGEIWQWLRDTKQIDW
jgi:hypothetical protein